MAEAAAYRRVGVVVPARDEEEWIGGCLAALAAAADRVAPTVRVHIVVVADDCADDTVHVARRLLADRDGSVRTIAARNVGRARASGIAQGLAVLGTAGTWLTTTDADTRVGPTWLADHLRLAARGWHGVAGTVLVRDWHLRPPATRRSFAHRQRRRGDGDGHPNVHGANLGFSARAYVRSGGLPAVASAEDHGLWEALSATGLPLLSSGALAVDTSARRSARTPDGFSRLLDDLEQLDGPECPA